MRHCFNIKLFVFFAAGIILTSCGKADLERNNQNDARSKNYSFTDVTLEKMEIITEEAPAGRLIGGERFRFALLLKNTGNKVINNLDVKISFDENKLYFNGRSTIRTYMAPGDYFNPSFTGEISIRRGTEEIIPCYINSTDATGKSWLDTVYFDVKKE